jgi:hypothetical protein
MQPRPFVGGGGGTMNTKAFCLIDKRENDFKARATCDSPSHLDKKKPNPTNPNQVSE